MNPDPIIVEQTYSAPPASVWKAITNPEQMRQWYFKPMKYFLHESLRGFLQESEA